MMVPIGYMAKRIRKQPDTSHSLEVMDVYSVSDCANDNFADYITFWKHNGYWLFDSPEIIKIIAHDHAIELRGTKLFYYEAHELEYDGKNWRSFEPEVSFLTNVTLPFRKTLEGFDVVTFHIGTSPEHSPLFCNDLAEKLRTNFHCLFETFEEAQHRINDGSFVHCEPGPYRIVSVYSIAWSETPMAIAV